jgi:hypothetical protein
MCLHQTEAAPLTVEVKMLVVELTISNQRLITKVSSRSSQVSLTTIQTLDVILVKEGVATGTWA